MSEQTSPGQSAPESLAEKAARAMWSSTTFLPWDAASGKERRIAEAQSWLDAIPAAGLAVVELPEPDSWDAGEDPRWRSDDDGHDVTAAVDLTGRLRIELERGHAGLVPSEARSLALRILAAVEWAERQASTEITTSQEGETSDAIT